MKILFIGNSKTYRQNMPKIFQNLTEKSGISLLVEKATKPGASLLELYKELEIFEKINSEKWDYVILQERTIKALQEDISEFEKGAKLLCKEIMKNNENTKIVYNACGVHNDFNIEEYQITNNHYEQIANITNGDVCYTGNAYINFHNMFPEIDLYEDKQHPTIVGAYLSACCLYNTIYKKKSSIVEYYDVLNPEIAKKLQKIADKIN